MECPYCKIEMSIGEAIDYHEPKNCISHYTIRLNHKDIKLIPVLKCPACGHSDDGRK